MLKYKNRGKEDTNDNRTCKPWDCRERGNLTKINSIEEINRSKMTGVFYMYENTG